MTKSLFTSQYESLCQLLIKTRMNAGLSQAQLARCLGRPQSFVSKYETRQRRLDVVEFLEVAACMGRGGPELLSELTGGKPRSAAGGNDGVAPQTMTNGVAIPARGRESAASKKKPATGSTPRRGR